MNKRAVLVIVSVITAACGGTAAPSPSPAAASPAAPTTAATPAPATPVPVTIKFGQVGTISDSAIFLADAKGRPYAQTGYQEGGARPYLRRLMELKGRK